MLETMLFRRCRLAISTPRLLFIGGALLMIASVHQVYIGAFVSSGAFDYMGVRAFSASRPTQLLFAFLALVPAAFLPANLRRPTDVVTIFLFYSVHLPTCVLLPFVSRSALTDQIFFSVLLVLALAALELRLLIPLVRVPRLRCGPIVFWSGILLASSASLVVLARGGYLDLSTLRLLDVYEQRQDLLQRAGELGPAFFYVANWTGVALAPLLIIAGLHRRNPIGVLAGVSMALAVFLASSNRSSLFAIPAVAGAYLTLRWTRGRYLGGALGLAFGSLAGLSLALDTAIARLSGATAPLVTWTLFHRTFTNNGFLSAIYVDLFESIGPGLFTDSFLRWWASPRFELPIAQLAGESFTRVPNVHANAHLWADGYANFGSAGVAFATVSLLLLLYAYDCLAAHKDRAIAAAALAVPATVLANTAVHTAFLSNGIFVTFLLVWLWRGGNRA